MKIKISELKANPFKKEINEGKLNPDIIEKIKANIKELGLMGSLPVFKKDEQYYLIAGHHRVEAIKQTFGKNYEIDVVVHNYSDDQVLRGMIVENLTQRSDELLEVTDNLALIRKHLREQINRSGAEQMKSKREDGRGGKMDEQGSIRDIYDWLNKNGEVMSIGKISSFLKVYDNLDKRLLKTAFKIEGGEGGKEEGKISIEDAKNLARIDKKDQFVMKDILDETGLDHKEKAKLTTEYLEADEDIKEKIKDKKLDIKDIQEAVVEKQIKENQTGEKTEFIPNMASRLSDFGFNVAKLEQQVAIFSKVFYSKNFSNRFHSLGEKERKVMSKTIFDIRDRVKKCYEEVEFFIKKMEK